MRLIITLHGDFGQVLTNESTNGTRAGKPESLKTTRTERKVIRYSEAISRLQMSISNEGTRYSRTLERIGKLKIDRARVFSESIENENASGLVAAMDRIADSLSSDADLED